MDHLGRFNLLGEHVVQIGNFISQWFYKRLQLLICFCHPYEQGLKVSMNPRFAALLDTLGHIFVKHHCTLNTKMGPESLAPLPFHRNPRNLEPFGLTRFIQGISAHGCSRAFSKQWAKCSGHAWHVQRSHCNKDLLKFMVWSNSLKTLYIWAFTQAIKLFFSINAETQTPKGILWFSDIWLGPFSTGRTNRWPTPQTPR